MLRSRIIPVLLMRRRGLVKTTRFGAGEEKYVGDPINAVKIYNEKEVDELTLLDIDATVTGAELDFNHLRDIAVEARMPLCYGGGVTTAAQASRLVSIGYEKVSVSAAAIERPALIRDMADAIGAQSVVVTLDVKKGGLMGGYSVVTHNATRKRKEKLVDLLRMAAEMGAGEIVINAVDLDGTLSGYDLKLAQLLRDTVSCPVTLVGGASSTDNMQELIDTIGVCGAAAGALFVFKGPYRAVLINYNRPTGLT